MFHKLYLLIGSPLCVMSSILQHLTKWMLQKEARWMEAMEHTKFVAELYKEQVKNGRLLLHENFAGASSWDMQLLKELEYTEGIHISVADQCMYGLRTWVQRSG